ARGARGARALADVGDRRRTRSAFGHERGEGGQGGQGRALGAQRGALGGRGRGPVLSLLSGAQVRATKSTTTRASSSPLSSCRKWPAPVMVVCACPFVPGIACCRRRSAPRVIGSESLKAVRKGYSKRDSVSHAFRFGGLAGSEGEIGTSIGNWRAPAL